MMRVESLLLMVAAYQLGSIPVAHMSEPMTGDGNGNLQVYDDLVRFPGWVPSSSAALYSRLLTVPFRRLHT